MKNCVLIVMAALTPLALMGCGDSGTGGGPTISPSDPDALSSAIIIPNSTRMTGSPPQPSGTGDAPTISGATELNIEAGGSQGTLEVNYESATGYDNCYVQVTGASDYWVINIPSLEVSGTVRIPIEIPATVDTGAFDFYTCIANPGGGVSNAVTTPVSVTNPFSNPGTGGAGGSGGSNGNFTCVDSGVPCPSGGGNLGYCVNPGLTACYYQVGSQQFNCGNCTDLTSCVQQTVNFCAGI